MTIGRIPGALPGARGPAVGPGSLRVSTTVTKRSIRALTRRTTGIRLVARRLVSSTGNVTLKLPRGPISTVSRQYY